MKNIYILAITALAFTLNINAQTIMIVCAFILSVNAKAVIAKM